MCPSVDIVTTCRARLVGEQRILHLPLLKLDKKPGAIDTEGYEGEQVPRNPLAEQFAAGPNELKPVTFNNGMTRIPPEHDAQSPRGANAKRKDRYQVGDDKVDK